MSAQYRCHAAVIVAGLALIGSGNLFAQRSRIAGNADLNRVIALPGNVHPFARPQDDRGPVDPALRIPDMTLYIKPTGAQQQALDKLLADQQNPASANYHRWLTPEQFADRFGASPADVATLTAWLKSQGFAIQHAGRGRQWISFHGTAAQVNAAFHTEIRRYQSNIAGKTATHFANATAPSIPEAFANVVGGIRGLDDFRATPPAAINTAKAVSEDYNSSTAGVHFLAPNDLATIYDVKPLYAGSIDGTGMSIVIVGETDLYTSDLNKFRTRFQLPTLKLEQVLAGDDPGLDTGGILMEANLDISWAAGIARNATIVYVAAFDFFYAVQYAVDQQLAPVISSSYSACELSLDPTVFRSIAQQANAEGITWVTASGDTGAGGCEPNNGASQATRGAIATFPADLPEVTAVGGTAFNENGGTGFWGVQNPDGSSALSYIPEVVWNDTPQTAELAASGGAPSSVIPKPIWQSGPGVPADGLRDVPDISLAASFTHDGYLVYFFGGLYAVGGTSASAPSFAGMLGLLNQSLTSKGTISSPGLGNINPTLYQMAQSTPSAFHDITAGDNLVPCVQAAPGCSSGSIGYAAGPGYDLATGLGSIDANVLIAQWSAQSAGNTTTTTLNPSPASVDANGTIQLTATVTAKGSGTPTGSVVFRWDETLLGTAALSGSGSTATASLTIPAGVLSLGPVTVWASYPGNGIFGASTGSAAINVVAPTGGSAVFVSVGPNPVYQDPTGTWTYQLVLNEMGGVASTLTDVTIGGVSSASSLVSWFSTTSIPAGGTLSSITLSLTPKTVPSTIPFVFKGMDASGLAWSRTVPVTFNGPLSYASLTLTSAPGSMAPNPSGNPSCQYSQLLTLQEQNGLPLQLVYFQLNSRDATAEIPQYFGTTHVAAYGSLQAQVCWPSPTAGAYSEVDGFDAFGNLVTATLVTPFGAAPASAGTLAVTPASVQTNAGTSKTAINVSVSPASVAWTAAIAPANRSTSWLTISPASGTGSGPLSLTFSAAGLGPGVYFAKVIVQAANAAPQYVEVPVTFVVGASQTTSIAGAGNAASYKPVFAPGAIVSVVGNQLAPNVAQPPSSTVQLPPSLEGVTATVNGITAPITYASGAQINMQIPYEVGIGPAVIGINNNGQVAAFPIQVAATAPGIFADGNLNLVPASSSTAGGYVVLFVTGDGDAGQLVATGNYPLIQGSYPTPLQPVTVTVGGEPAAIQFIGIPDWSVGITQVNIQVPGDLSPGVKPVVVSVGGVSSPPVNLTIIVN